LSIILKIGRVIFTILSFIWFLGLWSECRDLKEAVGKYRKAKYYTHSAGGFEKYADLPKERIERSKEDFYLNLSIFAVFLYFASICWRLA
jgi:hypothetical protein